MDWSVATQHLPRLPGQDVSSAAGLLEKSFLVPVVPPHIFGKNAVWCALQLANKAWPQSEDMEVFWPCQTDFVADAKASE